MTTGNRKSTQSLGRLTHYFFLVVVAWLTTSCDKMDAQKEVDTAGVLARAQSYLDQGQFRAATIEAKNALQKDPYNADAHLLLARVLLDVGQARAAVVQLEQLNDVPKTPDYVLTLSEAYIERNKFFSARDLLTKNAELFNGDSGFQYHLLLSQAKQGLDESEQAKTHVEKALAIAKDDDAKLIRAYNQQARLALSEDNEKLASERLEQALAIKKDPETLLLKGSIAYKNSKYDEAEDNLTNALIELKNTDIITPLRIKVLKGLIQTLTQSGRSSEALIYSKLLAEAAPNAEENQNKFLQALQEYRDGNLEKAEELLEEIYSGGANELSGRMLGLVNAVQGDLTEADTFLSEHIDPETASSKAIRVLTETKLRLNQTKEALAILTEKVAQTPNDPEILSIYGLTLLAAGEPEKAAEVIRKTLSIAPEKYRLRIPLANIYLSQGKTEKARQELLTAYQEKPEDEAVAIALGKFYVSANDIKAAQKLSQSLLEKSPKSAFAHGFAGSIAFAAKDFPVAVKHYQHSLKLDPENSATRFGLGRAYLGTKNYPKAIETLEQVIDSQPNSPEVYKAYISAHELNQTANQATTFLKAYADKDIQAWAPLAVLAEYHIRKNNSDKAVDLIDQALTRNAVAAYPQNVALVIYHNNATKAFQTEDYGKVRELLMKGLQLKPDHLGFLGMLTSTEIRSDQTREADKLIKQIETSHPDSTLALELKGDMALRNQQVSEGLTLYEQAWVKKPSDSLGNKIYRIKGQQKQNATAFLDEWIMKIPESDNALLLKAMQYQQTGDTSSAIRLYEKTLELNPNLLAAINNLAWLKFENSIDGAAELAAKGATLFPNSAAMQDTYGWILYKQGNIAQAKTVLKKAHELAPDNSEIKQHYDMVK